MTAKHIKNVMKCKITKKSHERNSRLQGFIYKNT